jgi:hypothetical protein
MPLASDETEQEALLAAMRATAQQCFPELRLGEGLVSAVKILDGETFLWYAVGRPHPRTEEVILAILQDEAQKVLLIFTPSQGVWQGSPIRIPTDHISEIRYRRAP